MRRTKARSHDSPRGPVYSPPSRDERLKAPLPPLLPGNSSSSSSSGSAALRTPVDENLPRKQSKKGSWSSWIAPKKQVRRETHRSSYFPPNTALSPPNVDLANETVDARSSPSDDGSDHSDSQCLVHHSDSSPLLDASELVAFPRSCNPYRRLPPSHPLKPSRDPLLDVFPDTGAIARHSEGLRAWISRPYYEERVYVWAREGEGDITCSRVAGPQLGVAALEYSNVLDLLAGTSPEPADEPLYGAIFDPTHELLSVPSCAIDPSAVHTPPVESLSRSPELPPLPATTSASLPAPLIPEMLKSEAKNNPSDLIPKKGVRFAEDDSKDDKIPLGYMLRVRKNKEQKAKFLRQERERRAIVQVESTLQEGERARKDIERSEMDKSRRAREQERKRLEEQERQRTYVEEVQAARIRREAARTGQGFPSTSSHTRTPERGWSEPPDSARPSTRRDSSSRGSELIVPTMNVPSYDASPASSMPPTPGSQHSFSRPPSSSEDVRNREARRISRRSSTVSDSSKHVPFQVSYNPGAPLMAFHPSWGMIPPVPPVPAIPSMPAVPLMPLLPPTCSVHDGPISPDGASSRSKSPAQGAKSNSPQRRSIDGLSSATVSRKAPLERSVHSQYDLPGAYPQRRTSSPRRASITPSHASQSHRRIVIS
ncbi:hypothetical protein BKA83DRAFT_4188569 [Pisolithus microcarpus]|nr:hypothetical protein BKA83DRAFT_4188569 [Pisolithus microcarpus]